MKTKLTLGIFQGGNKEFKGEKKIYQSLKEKTWLCNQKCWPGLKAKGNS